MIKLRKATSDAGIKRLAAEAENARLYVNGWSLCYELSYAKADPDSCKAVVIAYDGDRPIGICLVKTRNNGNSLTMTFVRSSYRRQGIGTKLMTRAVGKGLEFDYVTGTETTKGFFDQFTNADRIYGI